MTGSPAPSHPRHSLTPVESVGGDAYGFVQESESSPVLRDNWPDGIDYVCGPATGGLIVSQWTAHHLGVPSLFAQHDDDVAREVILTYITEDDWEAEVDDHVTITEEDKCHTTER